MNNHIITPQKFFIKSTRSYWATHFLSVVECLNYHKQLENSPQSLPSHPTWNFSDLRGNFPNNFFHHIRAYINNWGLQYFMVNFLNQKMLDSVAFNLIDTIYGLNNLRGQLPGARPYFSIAGNDSSLSRQYGLYLQYVAPRTLPMPHDEIDRISRHTDICIILEYQNGRVGIFGEIEGNYGEKLLKNDYWEKKSDWCLWGIGAVEGKTGSFYIDVHEANNGPKAILLFEKSNSVIMDFMTTLDCFEQLLNTGPQAPLSYSPNSDFAFFVDLLKKNWNTPAIQLMELINLHLDCNDVVGKFNHHLPVIPSLAA